MKGDFPGTGDVCRYGEPCALRRAGHGGSRGGIEQRGKMDVLDSQLPSNQSLLYPC